MASTDGLARLNGLLHAYIKWDAQDHGQLVPYMVDCLANDGHRPLAVLLRRPRSDGRTLEDDIAWGAKAADNPLSSSWVNVVRHFHNPCTHMAVENSPFTAANAASSARARAVFDWRCGRRSEAAIHLGRCLHLLCDVGGIPHHAANAGYIVLDPFGHRDYENWLKRNDRWREYAVTSGGFYAPWHLSHPCGDRVHITTSTRTYDWIDQISSASFVLMRLVDKHVPGYRDNYPRVAAQLVPHVIRWGAGFMQDFLIDPKVNALGAQ